MAEAADIENVKDLLPAEAEAEGWDTAKITTYLDAEGGSVHKTVMRYWESRVARLYTAIDVNEHGSTRSLSKVYDNAKGMLEYWQSRVAEDEQKAEEEEDGRIRFNTISRI